MTDPTASLSIRRGRRRGRSLPLADRVLRIGRDERCDLVIPDASVSPLHTTLERRSSGWVVINHGRSGTLLNATPVEGVAALGAGDRIQVGRETLLELCLEASDGATGRRSTRPRWRRATLLAVAVYAIALLAGANVLTRVLAGSGAPGHARTHTATAETVQLLTSGALHGEPIPVIVGDARSDLAADYHAILELSQSGRPNVEAERERRARSLAGRIDGLWFRAWQLEQQERRMEAIEVYREIAARVPTLRAPTTRIAARRLAELRREVARD